MKTASVRQIRLAFPTVLKAVQNGETVEITSRRKVVAVVGPPPPATTAKRPWADVDRWLAAHPPRVDVNLAALLSADRDDSR